jgi:hypothetical protein
MCSTDFDPCEVWKESAPRARKPHGCGECHLTIPPGETYCRIFCVFEGEAESYTAHLGCRAVARFVEKYVCGDEGSIPLHGLSEEIGNLNEYGAERLEPGEADELAAMGIDLIEWDADDKTDEKRAEWRSVAYWLWDIAKADYPPFERAT